MKLNNVNSKLIDAPEFRYIHLFRDYDDVIFDTKNGYNEALLKANTLKDKWVEKGEKNIRMYEVVEYTDLYTAEIETETEKLLFSLGNYPF